MYIYLETGVTQPAIWHQARECKRITTSPVPNKKSVTVNSITRSAFLQCKFHISSRLWDNAVQYIILSVQPSVCGHMAPQFAVHVHERSLDGDFRYPTPCDC